jgi:3-oxoacyl-[acyl-carrier protein] reductase
MQLNLDGRVVVVTGGSQGVGRAVVKKLCANGALVVFQGRDESAASETIGQAAANGTVPIFLKGDLNRYDSIAEMCDHAIEKFGRLDGAVGSGMDSTTSPMPMPFRETPPDEIMGYFERQLLPRAYLAHAAANRMATQGYGKIVLITTDGGRIPTPAESMIGAAGASTVYLTRAAARELSRDGIRINCVGITLTKDTPGYDWAMSSREDGTGGVLAKAFERLEAKMPFGLGNSGEVAEYVAFLLAPETDGITGATLSINRGGYFPVYA